MPRINWENQYALMHPDKLEKLLRAYVIKGFEFIFPDNLFCFQNRVKDPEGNIFTKYSIEKVLSKKLEFGNAQQIKALEALDFFKIAEAYYNLENYFK